MNGEVLSLEPVSPPGDSREVSVELGTPSKGLPAVAIRDGCKKWKNSLTYVLNDCNITVNAGEIYGLLGPSGCGKTTLLSSIVATTKLDSGSVRVFGKIPGTPESGIPGKLIGYMPQELALFPLFTVRESLRYFGTLGGMSRSQIEERTTFILDFLALKHPDQRVGKLSGGQQRRVSLAVALINSPPLLILDEPTVGVDPVLRKSIWDHLVEVCRDGNCTVIITTHYIEEASRAARVGLMRKGRILQEAPPATLMAFHGKGNLEEVFLKICEEGAGSGKKTSGTFPLHGSGGRRDSGAFSTVVPRSKTQRQDSGTFAVAIPKSKGEKNGGVMMEMPGANAGVINPIFEMDENLNAQNESKPPNGCASCVANRKDDPPVPEVAKKRRGGIGVSWSRSKALITKNCISIFRNWFLLLFQISIPPIEVLLFAATIKDPRNLPIAIYNGEVSSPSLCENATVGLYYSCDFVNSLDTGMVTKMWTNSSEEALELVLEKQAWGMLEIPENFTGHLIDRFLSGVDVNEKTINGSTMVLRLDLTVQIIGSLLKEEFLEAFRYFTSTLQEDSTFDVPKNYFTLPMSVGDPVFGEEGTIYAQFVAPGMLVFASFFMSMNLTILCLVQERKQGLLQRSMVAGTTALEVILSYVVTQLVILVLQNFLSILFMMVIVRVACNGPLILMILVILFAGFCGMTFGFLISASTKEETIAGIIFMGFMFACMFLTGFVWPREAMAPWLKVLTGLMPQTLAIEGLRNVMSRGVGLEDLALQMAFLGTTLWSLVHLGAAWFLMARKK